MFVGAFVELLYVKDTDKPFGVVVAVARRAVPLYICDKLPKVTVAADLEYKIIEDWLGMPLTNTVARANPGTKFQTDVDTHELADQLVSGTYAICPFARLRNWTTG